MGNLLKKVEAIRLNHIQPIQSLNHPI